MCTYVCASVYRLYVCVLYVCTHVLTSVSLFSCVDHHKEGGSLSWGTAGSSHRTSFPSSQELEGSQEYTQDSKNTASQEERLTNSSVGSLDQEFTFGDTTNTMGGTCMPAADLDKELADDDSNLPLGKLRSLGRDITVKQNSDLKFKEQTVPHHANTSVASMYIRSIGQNGGTQSGFNSIGQATRRHNQWHSRGQGVVSTGGTRSSKAGGGANGRAYQNRNSSTTSSKKGGGNNAGQMSTKGTNNRRRSKNTIQTKEGALSSLEQEPSGWGELPPTSSNSDIGTSAWGAPTEQRNQTANSSNGVGWGETAAWSGKNRDSNGTRAAGWHRQGAKVDCY